MKVALTGGTGVLGGAILARLSAEGHEVRALSRFAGRLDSAGVTWVHGALEERSATDELVSGCDAVLHCAFADTDSPEDFVQANVVGTLRLLSRLAAAGGSQFVYVSSLAVYGTEPWKLHGADRLLLDEDFPLWPGDFYAAHKLAMEKMVIAGSGDLGLNTSAFRIGCVLGEYPDTKRDYVRRFVADAREHGEIRERMGAYVITAEDAAGILVDALGSPSVSGRVFNTFDRWMDFAELAPLLAKVLGREVTVACDPAPAPEPAVRSERLRELEPVFATEERLVKLCARPV